MKIIRNTGQILLIAGLILFVSYLSMSEYRLTDNILHKSVNNQQDYEKLKPELETIFDKTYSSKFAFIKDVRSTINNLNDQYKSNEQWDKVIWTDYTFILTKNSSAGFFIENNKLWFFFSFIIFVIGAFLYIFSKYGSGLPGIKNNNIFTSSISSRGWMGIVLGVFLTGFYIILYWFPEYITNWVILVDPVSIALSGNPASQWFLYGFLYTVAVLVMGVRMILKYRHNKYQIYRTISVMFFQFAFAFIIPEILSALNKPWFDFKNMWPLDYDFFYSWNLDQLLSSGAIGLFMLVWGIALFAIGVPVFTYFFGKRWYCSWVCGCGGLAETAGDPFRQLSSKKLKSWKIERWLIHSVLVFAIVMTIVTLINYFSNFSLFGNATNTLHKWYGFLIGSAFSGVIGTGFYPVLGNRVWCRFGCPLAAYLGIVQRFKSKFRITTNGGQCISCGNCSAYCEMGIDVRSYAQNGVNIVRSSCVGCGVCAAVCPRGVLKLENKPEKGRINDAEKLSSFINS